MMKHIVRSYLKSITFFDKRYQGRVLFLMSGSYYIEDAVTI